MSFTYLFNINQIANKPTELCHVTQCKLLQYSFANASDAPPMYANDTIIYYFNPTILRRGIS